MGMHEALREKLENEIGEFRASYNNMSVIQAYNDWYIIGFKEEFFEMLMSEFAKNGLDDKEVVWIASLNYPLDTLYERWQKVDGAMNHDWEAMVDFVHSVYYEEKRRFKQDLYRDIKALDINVVRDASDDYFGKYDFVTHISESPVVLSATLPNNFDEEINQKFATFFKDKLLVKSCDYGCDTYPNGMSKEVAPGNVQTYQQPVWNFIEAVEQMFDCKCNYYNEVNGFEFIFEFGTGDNKGCYFLGAGNNGQEFSQGLYLNNSEQIYDAEFVKAITTIDKALYTLLEEYELCVVSKNREASLEDKIAEANVQKEASFFEGYPSLAKIKADYTELMEQIKDVRTVATAKDYAVKYPVMVEINGVSIDEFVRDGGTDRDIEWIRYETYGCLSYVYDRFDGKPMFDVAVNDGGYEFITDICIDDLTEENYRNWVKEDKERTLPVRTEKPER